MDLKSFSSKLISYIPEDSATNSWLTSSKMKFGKIIVATDKGSSVKLALREGLKRENTES